MSAKKDVPFEVILEVFRKQEKISDSVPDEDILSLPLSGPNIDQIDLVMGFPVRIMTNLQEKEIVVVESIVINGCSTIRDLLESVRASCVWSP